MSVNKWIGIGNLGKDPELRYTASGTAVASFSVACSERFKDKDGNQQEKTEWVNIVAWRQLAEICAKFLSKGSQVYIEGRLTTRSYDDKDGNKRYVTEIAAEKVEFLQTNSRGASQEKSGSCGQPDPYNGKSDTPSQGDFEDDIPW